MEVLKALLTLLWITAFPPSQYGARSWAEDCYAEQDLLKFEQGLDTGRRQRVHYRMKKFGRYVLIFVVWIFCLSVRVGDKTIFDHAHGVLVENRVVSAIDQELSDLWRSIGKTARVAYRRISGTPQDDEQVRSG